MKTPILAALLAVLALPAAAWDTKSCLDKPVPPPFAAEAYAIDGDTVAAIGVVPHIRLWGIQAPELRGKDKQESIPGMRSRAALEDILTRANHQLQVTPTKWDRYCRMVAITEVTIDGTKLDLSDAMLRAGMAYGFYLDDAVSGHQQMSRGYADAEAKARAGKAGLWPMWLGETR